MVGRGMVGLVFGEADGEVLDVVRYAEFFKNRMNLPSSSMSQFSSLVEVTVTSSSTLSGRL